MPNLPYLQQPHQIWADIASSQHSNQTQQNIISDQVMPSVQGDQSDKRLYLVDFELVIPPCCPYEMADLQLLLNRADIRTFRLKSTEYYLRPSVQGNRSGLGLYLVDIDL